MKKLFSSILLTIMLITLTGVGAMAATANPSPSSPGYILMPFHLTGPYTASLTGVVKFKMPWPAILVNASATANASSGTSPTLTVNVKQGSQALISSAISVTAGSITEAAGLSAYPKIPDESTVSVDFGIGGTTPSWSDIDVLLVIKRM